MRSFLPLWPLLAVACSGAAAAGSHDSDFTVHPTDGTTEIELVAPPGATGHVVAIRDGQSVELALGGSTALAPGAVKVESSFPSRDPWTGAIDLTLGSDTRTTIKLAGVQFRRTTTDRLMGLDVDGTWNVLPAQRIGDSQLGATTVQMPNARVFYTVGLHRVVSQAPEATVDKIAIDDATDHNAVRILPPASREFPDVDGVEVTLETGDGQAMDDAREFTWKSLWGIGRDKSGARGTGVGDSPILVITEPTVTRASLVWNWDIDTYGHHMTKLDLPLAMVDADHPVNAVQLQRLDVDDVEVKLADGTKTKVPGTFQVSSEQLEWSRPKATHHGMDVLPGVYRVDVTYTHPADQSVRKFTTTVDLTH